MHTLQTLLDRYRDGDAVAAEELLNRFSTRLIALARSRIQGRLQRRLDPEDVVQSAMGSFFRRVGDGAYQVEADDDLWPLLATITINKLRKRIEFHQAGKRSLDGEESLLIGSATIRFEPSALAYDPGHDEEVLLTEVLEAALDQLEPRHRMIVQHIMAGESVAEVSEQLDRTERTVRRVLDRFRTILGERLDS
ncbi:sigma-70 family RNA polymerase sigma factor [bacterium]|nr:sigma-70 family RNA polymerase sigma factor [bacterium]